MTNTNICLVEGCTNFVKARGWCGTHYERWRKNGSLETHRPSLEERFWAKVNKTDTCWLWQSPPSACGYGQFNVNGFPMKAHRFAYELLVGPIPEGLHIDHLCHIALCVNPAHLEAVTPKVNSERSFSAIKSHCVNGHPRTPENTYIRKNGAKMCRPCIRYQVRMAKIKRRQSKDLAK